MLALPTYGAGGYDWVEIWRYMYDCEREQTESVTDPLFEISTDYWAPRAMRFAKSSRDTPQPDSFMQHLLPQLRPTDTVLDIGAGTGRYLALLSQTVAHVIAVEPSAAMRTQMEQYIAEKRLVNVEVIAEEWPFMRSIQADIVFAAHVVYAVRDIKPFVQAMHATATRMSCIYVGLHHPSLVLAPFWERIHRTARLPLPAALETLNVLYQLGFYATMDLVSVQRHMSFTDEQEALTEIQRYLRYVPHHQRDQTILSAINELCVRNTDGSLSVSHPPRFTAILRWAAAT